MLVGMEVAACDSSLDPFQRLNDSLELILLPGSRFTDAAALHMAIVVVLVCPFRVSLRSSPRENSNRQ